MRFAVQLHGSFPMRRYPELARLVERYPFHELTVHDVLWWRPVWQILALVGQATSRMLVGPDVTHPYLMHPAAIAQNLAGLDELTQGRAVFGIGRGSLLEPLGIHRVNAESRVRDTVAQVRRLLAAGKAGNAEPSFYWSPPRSSLTVFVGAFGDRMVESAASWADEIRPPATWDTRYFSRLRQRAKLAASVASRELAVGCEVWTSVGRDRQAARELGRQVLARFLGSMKAMTDFYQIDQRELCGDPAAISDRTLDTFVAAGTPDEIAEGVERLQVAGAETLTFSGRLGPDTDVAIQLLGDVISRIS